MFGNYKTKGTKVNPHVFGKLFPNCGKLCDAEKLKKKLKKPLAFSAKSYYTEISGIITKTTNKQAH